MTEQDMHPLIRIEGRKFSEESVQIILIVLLSTDIPDVERTDEEINMLRQIAVDCPSTVHDVSFFQQEQVQKSLERILYIWAIRHPASGYVQGINDLATPFLVVFLSEHHFVEIGAYAVFLKALYQFE